MDNHFRLIVAALGCLIWASMASAAVTTNIGYGYQNLTLSTDDGTDFTASLQGVQLQFIERRDGLFGELSGSFLMGDGDVDVPGENPRFDARVWEAQYLIGSQFNEFLGAYFGVAYRDQQEKLESSAGDVDITHTYLHTPLGVFAGSPAGTGLGWRVYAEYGVVWSGEVSVDDGTGEVKANQDSGNLLNLGGEIQFSPGEGWRVAAGPYYRLWDINESDDGLFPAYEQSILGLNLSVVF